MEFSGQRGDAHSPWSVGKYAKRSATIHLCSEDAQSKGHTFFEGTIASYDTANHAVTLFDPGQVIRDKFDNLQEPAAELRNAAMGLEFSSSSLALYGGTGVSAAGDDFTKVQLSAEFKGFDALTNPFTPLDVRTTTGGDYQGLNVADSDIKVERQGGRYYFKVREEMFPLIAQAKQNSKVRLARDYDWGTSFADQAKKGYVLELINWDAYPGNEDDIDAADAFLVTDLQFAGLEDANGQRVVFVADQLPADLLVVLLALGVNADDTAISLGGTTVAALDNPADRLFTWNLFPATRLSAQQDGFDDPNDNHCNYSVTIPNTIGYPEHKRCLVQVQSLSVHSEAYAVPDPSKRINPVYVGVEVEGIAVQNNFSSHIGSTRFGGKVQSTQLVGTFNLESKALRQASEVHYDVSRAFAYGFDNNRSILTDGVLCSSPFGKQIRIKLLNLTNKELLNTNSDNGNVLMKETPNSKDIINNPTHLTLRLLFLDDDDLPMR